MLYYTYSFTLSYTTLIIHEKTAIAPIFQAMKLRHREVQRCIRYWGTARTLVEPALQHFMVYENRDLGK